MNEKRRNLISEDANIFLIGMMGSGKSTAGPILAKKLGFGNIDLDHLIEEQCGEPVQSILQQKGEEAFRKIEAHVLTTLTRVSRHVIACGGGTPCSRDNLTFMQAHGLVIYLKASPSVLAGRVKQVVQLRPLLSDLGTDQKIVQRLTDLLHSREPVYQKADFIVNAKLEPAKVVALIVQFLERFHPDISPGFLSTRKEAE